MVRIVKLDGSYGIHPDDYASLHLQPEDDIRLECRTMYPEITFRLTVNTKEIPCSVTAPVQP